MRLFRRSLPLDQASTRLATPADLVPIQHLFRGSGRRYLGFGPEELPALLADTPVALLLGEGEAWGAMVTSWPTAHSTWLRGFALAEGIQTSDGVGLLLPALAQGIAAIGLRQLYFAGDESADRWLQPALLEHGFRPDIEVVVYEKRDLHLPAPGNPAVLLRPATPADLPTVLALDARCFEDQWVKTPQTLGQAVSTTPFFVLAEIDGWPCGYALATSHFGGRLLHLVRIAVDPAVQGRGVGTRLMAELIALAARSNTDAITLNTQANNHRAQHLYESFGFVLSGERQLMLRYEATSST